MVLTDQDIIQYINKGDQRGIKFIYDNYYNYLCHAVYKLLPESSTVEDVVQDVIMEIWKKRERLVINISLKAYLRRASINKTLNLIRSRRMVFENDENYKETFISSEDIEENMEVEELKMRINESIDGLPDKCRTVFMLSRFEDMSYKQIAAELDISIKTVENQISKALKILRLAVLEYNN